MKSKLIKLRSLMKKKQMSENDIIKLSTITDLYNETKFKHIPLEKKKNILEKVDGLLE